MFSTVLMPLSKVLQSPDLDVVAANELILITEARINALTDFDPEKCGEFMSKAKAVCARFQIPVKDDLEKIIFEAFIRPYAVHVGNQFDLRFKDFRETLSSFWYLLPKNANLRHLNEMKLLFQVSICLHL